MSITHFQETVCYCCQCKKDIVLGKLQIQEGDKLVRYNPVGHGWTSFILNNQIHYLCPRHTLGILISVDGKPYKED